MRSPIKDARLCGEIDFDGDESNCDDSDMENLQKPRDRKRVGFTTDTTASSPVSSRFPLGSRNSLGESSRPAEQSPFPSPPTMPAEVHAAPISPSTSTFNVAGLSRPKPALRVPSYRSISESDVDQMLGGPLDYGSRMKALSQSKALQSAERMARVVVRQYGSHSAPGSRRGSFQLHDVELSRGHYAPKSQERPAVHVINMEAMAEPDSEDNGGEETKGHGLSMWNRHPADYFGGNFDLRGTSSGQRTPAYIQPSTDEYVTQQQNSCPEDLSSVPRFDFHQPLWSQSEAGGSSRSPSQASTAVTSPWWETPTPQCSPPASGRSTPISKDKLLNRFPNPNHKWNSSTLTAPSGSIQANSSPTDQFGIELSQRLHQQQQQKQKMKFSHDSSRIGKSSRSADAPSTALYRPGRPNSAFKEVSEVDFEISEVMERQEFVVKLGNAFLFNGAPAHRIEEYLARTTIHLGIHSQFLLLPGCLVIIFSDEQSRTTDIKLVPIGQSINLMKLKEIHEIYRTLCNGGLDLHEAYQSLESTMEMENFYTPWMLVVISGLACASVGPFAFDARWLDLPMCFLLGATVAAMKHVFSKLSSAHAYVFELSSIILVSFAARLLGSIRHPNGSGEPIFCFSAIVQSSIALILPGYNILCAAWELQAGKVLSGVVRVGHVAVYCYFMTFALGLGTALAGKVYSSATANMQCNGAMGVLTQLPFVAVCSVLLTMANQGGFAGMAFIVFVSLIGYGANSFSNSFYFHNQGQYHSILGAFSVGALANLYFRFKGRGMKFLNRATKPLFKYVLLPLLKTLFPLVAENLTTQPARRTGSNKANNRGMLITVMLPALWLQVPSGISAHASLVSGVITANETNNRTAAALTSPRTWHGNHGPLISYGLSASAVYVAMALTTGLGLSSLLLAPRNMRSHRHM